VTAEAVPLDSLEEDSPEPLADSEGVEPCVAVEVSVALAVAAAPEALVTTVSPLAGELDADSEELLEDALVPAEACT
jgi:hypothetical protein